MRLEHPGGKGRVGADQRRAGQELSVAAQAGPGEDAEHERAADVHRERAERELGGVDARGHGGVEPEAQKCPDAAEQRHAHPHQDPHATTRTRRTIAVAIQIAAKPATRLAAAYPSASPIDPRSSIRNSSSCIVENVVNAPQKPVPSSGRLYADSGSRS